MPDPITPEGAITPEGEARILAMIAAIQLDIASGRAVPEATTKKLDDLADAVHSTYASGPGIGPRVIAMTDKPDGFWAKIIDAVFGGLFRQTDGPGATGRTIRAIPLIVFLGTVAIILAMVLTDTSVAELLGFDPRGEVEALEDAADALEEIADEPAPLAPEPFPPEASGDFPEMP